MEVKEKYIKKYWYQIIRDQIADELTAQGYEVDFDKEIGNGILADIYAERNGDKQIIEISARKTPKEQFFRLHNYAINNGMRLKAVVANINSFKTTIEWDELESILCDYVNKKGYCKDLGYSVTMEDVIDIDFSKIQITGNEIYVEGNAVCEVEIQIDEDGDIDLTRDFPMTFRCVFNIVDGKWNMKEDDAHINIDSSAFYE